MHPRQNEVLKLLKLALKSRAIKYRDLARGLKVSELTIRRSLTQQGLSVDRLFEICDFARIPPEEIFVAAAQDESATYHFTIEEDRHFAKRVDLYLFLLEIATQDSLARATKNFGFSQAAGFKRARELERMGFIEIFPKDRLKFPKGSLYKAHPRGALRKDKRLNTVFGFMGGDFSGALDFHEFSYLQLTESAVLEIREKLAQVLERVIQLGFRDRNSRTKTYGVVMALRPWQYSPAEQFKSLGLS